MDRSPRIIRCHDILRFDLSPGRGCQRRVVLHDPEGHPDQGSHDGTLHRQGLPDARKITYRLYLVHRIHGNWREAVHHRPFAPASNDIFVLRQPKFDIIIPPPAVLPDEGAIPTTAQTAHLNATTGRWVMVRANSPEISIAGTRTIPRGSLPRESSIYSKDGGGYDRSSSFSHQSSIRRLPPIPRGPQSTALPPVIETQRTLPPSSLPVTSHSREYSVSRSAPSHTHSRSFDSVASVSWMSDSTLLGPAGGDGLKGDDSSDQS